MTTTSTKPAWLESMQVADRPTPADAREFFGVPPDPESALDDNIARKRRTWNSKVRSRKASSEAVEQVKAAVKLIDFLAQQLKRGGDGPYDLDDLEDVFREPPKTKVGELRELWEIVERLLAGGKLEEALKVANDARERFGDSPVAHTVFAWVAALASRDGAGDNRLREQALASADIALAADEPAIEAFQAKATLLLDLRRGEEALAILREAEAAHGGQLPTVMDLLLVEAYVAGGEVDAALDRAVLAVDEEPDNLAVRSSVTLSLIQAMQFSLLPIRSQADLARYKAVVEVAAWCAQGAPEAEDLVLPFRMWGVVADNRMYAGDVMNRAYAGVLSGFLMLPLLNRRRSKQQWEIIDKGPGCVSPDVFDQVALGAVSRAVHGPITDRLAWWRQYWADAQRRMNQAKG